ncbi:MAG: hypothetical protein RIT14_2994 [Pseudomonadota bacterium]
MSTVAVMAALALALVACGPIPVPRAEQQCLERARLAAGPRGTVGMGVNSQGGAGALLELDLSSDYLMGRDPSAVFESCVYQKSGQPPSRPLYAFPEWKG